MTPLVLNIQNLETGEQSCFLFNLSPVFVGRDPFNTIVLDLPCVSQWHFVLTFSSSSVTMRMMCSAGPTYVRGRMLGHDEVFELKVGDTIRVGPFAAIVGQSNASVGGETRRATPKPVPMTASRMSRATVERWCFATESASEPLSHTSDDTEQCFVAELTKPSSVPDRNNIRSEHLKQRSISVLREIAEDWRDIVQGFAEDFEATEPEDGLRGVLAVCGRTLSSLRRLEVALNAGQTGLPTTGTLLDTVVRAQFGGPKR